MAVTLKNVVVHDGAQQFAERTAHDAVVPPHNLALKRFEAGERQPADLALVHAVDRCGGKARDRQVMHHTLERAATRNAQRRGDCQLGARSAAIFLRGEVVSVLFVRHRFVAFDPEAGGLIA